MSEQSSDATYRSIYVYAPDGQQIVTGIAPPKEFHIPRQGEVIKVSDHTDDTPDDYGERLRVKTVETEFRLNSNIGRGEHWNQLVYIKTEEYDDE